MIGTELRPRVLQTGFCASASYLFGTFNLGVWVSGFKLWGVASTGMLPTILGVWAFNNNMPSPAELKSNCQARLFFLFYC